MVLLCHFWAPDSPSLNSPSLYGINISAKLFPLSSTEDQIHQGELIMTELVFVCTVLLRHQNSRSHLSQPYRYFVITALDDSFEIASWPLTVVCSYSSLVLWLSPSAGMIDGFSTFLVTVWFSLSIVWKPKAPLVSILFSQICLKTAENGKNACAAKRVCHISTICCVSHL